jgi:hypothetical protein
VRAVAKDNISTVGRDMEMLRDLCGELRAVSATGGHRGETAAGHLTAFSDILDQLESAKRESLTDKQRGYMKRVHEEYVPKEVDEAWRAARVIRGREVPLPEVLKNLPKKPPGRS